MTKGERYSITCTRKRARDVTYEGVYLGRNGGWSLFELESGVTLRVEDEVLSGTEATASSSISGS